MAKKPLPDVALLRERLEYDQSSGKLFWKPQDGSCWSEPYRAKIWNARYAGKEALGASSSGGYKGGHFGGKSYLAHRVVWAMWHGFDPGDLEIDHINGKTQDNRIENLRAVNHATNGKNQRKTKNNTSGANGVRQVASGRWMARVTIDGKRKSIGTFNTLREAEVAQRAISLYLGFHPNHGR